MKQKLERSLKNMKGITLVALVVTIIVLLILVAVTLNLVLGENGIITKSLIAKKEYENAIDDEMKKLDEIYSSILISDNGTVTLSTEDLRNYIQSEIQTALQNSEIIQNTNSSETVPVGSIISYIVNNNPPTGYLACDGAVYNISDYPELAEAIKTGVGNGSYNYYGGNGTTTFAVPNLQGEFLRGAGSNESTNLSGGNVGEHQNQGLPEISGKFRFIMGKL